MNRRERKIYKTLRKSDQYCYVDHNENAIYLALENGLLVLTSVDSLREMSSEEINKFIQESLAQLLIS